MCQLTEPAQSELLKIARLCLENYLKGGEKMISAALLPELSEQCGVFVTLQKSGILRGCIGVPVSGAPLYETVQHCAISSASADPRFPPVTLSELDEIQIEISVLSPMERVDDIDDIKVGVHGLLVEKEGRRGLLLPQVALEHHWDRETFLRQVCRKAGVPRSALCEGALLQSFTAQVFAENTSAETL